MTTKEYKIENLDCANCSLKIQEEISKLPEVDFVHLDFVNKKIRVRYSSPMESALERLNQIASGIEPGVFVLDGQSQCPQKQDKLRWSLIALGLVLLIASYLLKDSAALISVWLAWALIGHRVILNAFKKLYKLRVFDEHFLMTIASFGAIWLGEYTEAAAVMLLYEIGQYFETKAVNRSRNLIRGMVASKPEKALLLQDGKLIEKKTGEIIKGAIIVVNPGDRVPLDSLVLRGRSSIDSSSLTGESEPQPVEPGSTVLAGFVNLSGRLELEVTAPEAESAVARILNLIENASQKKSTTEKFITRFATIYTPIVVIMAALLVVIPVLLGASLELWLPRALIFLIVSCPCAFVIAIPLTYYIAIGLAAKHGIIIKGSSYLDALRQVKSFVFDKTGTLTTGKLSPGVVFTEPGVEEDELWESVYRCEFSSAHPLALAVKKAYQTEMIVSNIEEYTEFPGKGILMRYAGDEYLVGSLGLIRSLGYTMPITPAQSTAIYAVKNHLYQGYISFTDEIKSSMAQALKELKQEGAQRHVMLSGDQITKAGQVAEALHLDEYHAELVPEEKLQKLEEVMARTEGLTAYVGDGLNDAPVLSRADLGIAMGELGNAASIEAADIVLLQDKPEQLVTAVRISHRTHVIIIQNIVLALGLKVLVMIAGALGLGNLWEAVIADVGVTILAVFNAMRISRFRAGA